MSLQQRDRERERDASVVNSLVGAETRGKLTFEQENKRVQEYKRQKYS